MVKTKKASEKELSVKAYIALAVFTETTVNALFSALFHGFINFFYSDYAHLTVWGDVVAIVSVVFSFIIYDGFAHAAYKDLKNRIVFLGIVYVASKAASIIHYSVGILANIINAEALLLTPVTVALSILEIADDVFAAVWLMGYFDKKFAKENKTTG